MGFVADAAKAVAPIALTAASAFGSDGASSGDILWNDQADSSGISWADPSTSVSSGGGGAAMGLSAIAGLAGAGTKAAGQIKQGQAASQAAGYNANIADLNAKVAEENAGWIGQIGEQQTRQAQMKTRETVGGITANQAASGIDVNSGSAKDVRESARQIGQEEAVNARTNAARLAYGQKIEAASSTAQGELYRSQAKQSTTASGIEASSTLLSALSNPEANYLGFLQGKSLTGS